MEKSKWKSLLTHIYRLKYILDDKEYWYSNYVNYRDYKGKSFLDKIREHRLETRCNDPHIKKLEDGLLNYRKLNKFKITFK